MQKIELPIPEEKSDKISPSRPDFGRLKNIIIIIIPSIVFIYLIFYGFAYLVIGKISIEKEKELFGKSHKLTKLEESFDQTKLSNQSDLLDKYDIYIKDSLEVNAYAELGATVTITTGLLNNLETEEELLFIIGHEIRHIENRDVLQSLLTVIPFKLSLYYLGSNLGIEAQQYGDLYNNYRSRDTELKADEGGIELINSLGLNLNCSSRFFKRNDDVFSNYLEFTSTHPSNKKRIENIEFHNNNPIKECTKLNYYTETQKNPQ